MYQEPHKIQVDCRAPTRRCALLCVGQPLLRPPNLVSQTAASSQAQFRTSQRQTPPSSVWAKGSAVTVHCVLQAPFWRQRKRGGYGLDRHPTVYLLCCPLHRVTLSRGGANVQMLQVSRWTGRGPQALWDGWEGPGLTCSSTF